MSVASWNIMTLKQSSNYLYHSKGCIMFRICYIKRWLNFPEFLWEKCHKLSSSKQQKFILLQFWRLEAQNQAVSRVGSFWSLWGRIYSIPFSFWWLLAISSIPWLVNPSLQSLSCLHNILLSVCLYSNSPLLIKTQHWPTRGPS